MSSYVPVAEATMQEVVLPERVQEALGQKASNKPSNSLGKSNLIEVQTRSQKRCKSHLAEPPKPLITRRSRSPKGA